MTKIITKLNVYDFRTYTIIYDQGFYQAIDEKYIDENGTLTETLNGLQTYASKDLTRCMETARDAAEIDYYMHNGMSKAEAFCKVMKIPMTEDIKKFLES